MKKEILKYIKGVCSDNEARASEIIAFIEKDWENIKNDSQTEIEHTIDYLAQSNKKLTRASYKQTKPMAEKWTKRKMINGI